MQREARGTIAADGEFDQSQKMVTIHGGDESKPVPNVGYHWSQYTLILTYTQVLVRNMWWENETSAENGVTYLVRTMAGVLLTLLCCALVWEVPSPFPCWNDWSSGCYRSGRRRGVAACRTVIQHHTTVSFRNKVHETPARVAAAPSAYPAGFHRRMSRIDGDAGLQDIRPRDHFSSVSCSLYCRANPEGFCSPWE